MKLKQNKGLTFVEVIIAMCIISIVMGIGYRVFNKSKNIANFQGQISDVQNGMNFIRDFITKDIKYCDSVVLKNGEMEIDISNIESKGVDEYESKILDSIKKFNKYSYEYNILNEDKSLKSSYIINVYNKSNKKYFSISKKDSKNVILQLISKQEICNSKLPMNIKFYDDMYNIQINYNNNLNKLYKFSIYNKHKESNSNGDLEEDDSKYDSMNYLYYCLGQAHKSLKQSNQNEIANFIDPILKTSSKANYSQCDIKEMKEQINGVLEKVRQIRIDLDRENLNKYQDSINRAEYYLEVGTYITDYLGQEEIKLSSLYLYNIGIKELHDNVRQDKLIDVIRKIELLKQSVVSQKFFADNSIGLKADYQGHYMDEQNKIVHEKQQVISDFINVFQEMYNMDINSEYAKNKLDNQAQDMNLFIDWIIDFSVDLKTYIYINIPLDEVKREYAEDIYKDVNKVTNNVIEALDTTKKELVKIKYLFNKVNYIKVN